MAWTSPRTWVAAEFVTAALLNSHVRDNLNHLNDTRVKYAQQTTSASATSGGTELTVLTAPAFTPISSSRLLKVSAHWRGLSFSVDLDVAEVRLSEGGTTVQAQSHKNATSAAGQAGGTIFGLIASPSAAAHTYSLRLVRLSGTGTITMQGDPTYPITICVEDVGAA